MDARMTPPGSRRGRAALIVGSLVLAGCASYQLAPLAVSHPAHPDAPTAPQRPPSRTLAYAPSDIPSVQPVSPMATAPGEEPGSRPTDAGSQQTVVGEGHVVATNPSSSQLVLDHEEIKGFMEAMTMGYRVDPPSLLAGLKPGDTVRFTIDIQKRTITQIERLRSP